MDHSQAWLEFPSGDRIFITTMCSIGRGPENRVVIPLERVSRRHAVIRRNDDGTYAVMDMGSSNGTFLNGQKLTRTAELKNGAIIEIGLQKMTFRTPPASAQETSPEPLKEAPCWLLVVAAAQRGARASSQELIDKTHESWTSRVQRVIAKYQGRTMRGLDDSLLAFWPGTGADQKRGTIAAAIQSLRSWQLHTEQFRFALHFGVVQFQRSAIGEDAPTGAEVIAAMQLERIASRLNCDILVTEQARTQLADALETRPLVVDELREFQGTNAYFTLVDPPRR
jgi:hypothetical protein